MATKTTQNSNSTLLIFLLVLITFPFWIAVIAALGGVMAGLFGAVFGIIGGIFGALGTLIALPFKMLFGGHWWPHFHFNGCVVVGLIILAVLIAKSRKA